MTSTNTPTDESLLERILQAVLSVDRNVEQILDHLVEHVEGMDYDHRRWAYGDADESYHNGRE